jgi:hypothetical protein
MLRALDASEQAAAWREITERLAAFETAGGFAGPCELIVVAGTAPSAEH